MVKAFLKGSMLWAFGNVPGGPKLYRTLTRRLMGTQITHVDKLARVWPGYLHEWRDRCGFEPAGKRLWIHEGWTPFPFIIGTLITGEGTTVTNEEGVLLDRYSRHAIEMASLELDVPAAHRERVAALDPGLTAAQVVEALDGRLISHVSPTAIPLEDGSMDLCHSGGALEHYPPEKLSAFAGEMFRVLSPGGIASHVFDMRDHLYHFDKAYAYLRHWSLSKGAYRFCHGHSLGYHNRLLPAQTQAIFEAAGFEVIALRRLLLPAAKYSADEADMRASLAGLPRERLHPDFAAATDWDLHTAAAHYLLRKPMA